MRILLQSLLAARSEVSSIILLVVGDSPLWDRESTPRSASTRLPPPPYRHPFDTILLFCPMDLCIGCASSISTTSTTQLPTTPCCNRKICLRCDATNPRLKTYNPCLSCFGAADVVTSAPETNKRALKVGGVDPDDVFVVGGEDEDEDDDDDETPPPPMYNELENATHTAEAEFATTNILAPEVLVPSSDLGEGSAYSKSEYWIKPKDTLSGIALKYGVDVSPFHCAVLTINSQSSTPQGPYSLQTQRTPSINIIDHTTPLTHSDHSHPTSFGSPTRITSATRRQGTARTEGEGAGSQTSPVRHQRS